MCVMNNDYYNYENDDLITADYFIDDTTADNGDD
jgi:hypothetical protein